MKHFFIFFVMLGLFISCVQPQSNKTSLSSKQAIRDKEASEREALLKSYKDSTVHLSFSGIKLGEPIRKTMTTARSEGKIRNVKFDYNNGVAATCRADLFLPGREQPIEVNVKVTSHQDTITSFVVMSTDYDTRNAVVSLYKDRYNIDAAIVKEEADYWGDKARRGGYNAWIWTFKNQSITLSNFYEEEREHYVKNPKLRNPQNRYGIKYKTYFKTIVITYNDTYQSAKAKEYEDQLAAKQQKIKKEQESELKAKEKAMKEEQKARAINQDL